MSRDDGTLECPDCGGTRFGWTVQQVQYGPIVEVNGRRDGVADENGAVMDDDLHKGVVCQSCESEHPLADLEVPTDE